jgi:hypothetical protein
MNHESLYEYNAVFGLHATALSQYFGRRLRISGQFSCQSPISFIVFDNSITLSRPKVVTEKEPLRTRSLQLTTKILPSIPSKTNKKKDALSVHLR